MPPLSVCPWNGSTVIAKNPKPGCYREILRPGQKKWKTWFQKAWTWCLQRRFMSLGLGRPYDLVSSVFLRCLGQDWGERWWGKTFLRSLVQLSLSLSEFHASELPRWLSWDRIHLLMQETQETRIQSLSQEDPLEEEVATHSSILAWRIP